MVDNDQRTIEERAVTSHVIPFDFGLRQPVTTRRRIAQQWQEKERLVLVSLALGLLCLAPDLVAAVLARSIMLLSDSLKSANETLAVLFSWLALRQSPTGGARPDFRLRDLDSLPIVRAMNERTSSPAAVTVETLPGAVAALRFAGERRVGDVLAAAPEEAHLVVFLACHPFRSGA